MDSTILISSLQQRYGLSSRQAVYDRIAALRIEPVARGKLSTEQLDKLDKLNEFLSKNPRAAIADFPIEAEINPVRPDLSTAQLDNQDLSTGQLDKPTADTFVQLVREIAMAISSRPQESSPTKKLEDLEKIAVNGWLIGSSEIQQLIGIKPPSYDFVRGSFTFMRTGTKIGRQTAWKVVKNNS